MDQDDLVGSMEAASMADVDRATFNRWVERGLIAPVVSMPGKRGARLFSRADVAALLAEKASA